MPLGLNDAQLAVVMKAAKGVPVEKRSIFLERLAARLQLYGTRHTGADLDAAVRVALKGLVQVSAA
jgi:hypothetical protein